MNESKIVEKILERGGHISWRDKYFLFFEELYPLNPLLEWSGYAIYKIDKENRYHCLYSSMNVEDALENYLQIIDDDLSREEIV